MSASSNIAHVSRASLLGAALLGATLLTLAPHVVFGQADTLRTLDPVEESPRPVAPEPPEPPESSDLDAADLDDLDRQIDAGGEGEDSDLWEDYQRYSDRDREGDRDRSLDPVDRGYRHHSGERVKIGDTVIVHKHEEIYGDVVAIGGDVHVYGKVDGDVVAVGGNVILEEGAFVDGDAVAVGGSVDTIGESEVTGEVVSVDLGFNFGRSLTFAAPFTRSPGSRFVDFTMHIIWVLAWLGFALLFYAIAGGRLEVVSRRIEAEPGQSFLIGLLGAVVTPMAFVVTVVLLAVTVIGILLIPVLGIVLVLMIAGGFAAASLALGRRLAHARESGDTLSVVRSPYFYLTVGFIALEALFLIGHLMKSALPFMGPVSSMVGVLGAFVCIFASVLGYGAILTSRFGTEVPGDTQAFLFHARVGSGPPPPPPGSAPQGPPPPPGSSPPEGSPPPTGPEPPEAGEGEAPPGEERPKEEDDRSS